MERWSSTGGCRSGAFWRETARDEEVDPMTSMALVGGTLIDGTGAAPAADSSMVVRDGRIAELGPASGVNVSGDLQRIDLRGKYLIPGLMDANVHLVLHIEPDVILRYEPGCYDELVLEAAQVALGAGITTVFDTWGPLEALRRVRDRINTGEVPGSRIFCAGNIIGLGGPWSADFEASTYGDALNPAVVDAVNREWEQGVGNDLPWMSAGDVRQTVREYIVRGGIDFVKYSSSTHKAVKFITFSPDTQRAIVEEAHAAGMTAQACAMTPEALKLAIQSGVDLLQHGDITGRRPMPLETLKLIAERQLPCIALLVTQRYQDALKEDPNNWFTEYMEVKQANDRNLIAAGARLMLASDGGVLGPSAKTSPLFGRIYVWESPDVPTRLGTAHIAWLKAAIECGMTPMDALLSATRNIAQAYARNDLGTLEPGKRADVVVLDGDPLTDIENYGRIAHVIKDGEMVDRSRLPERRVLTAEAVGSSA
jgi:imidazolonepropionase-like amidohydrolase